jgi:hypothetical protein
MLQCSCEVFHWQVFLYCRKLSEFLVIYTYILYRALNFTYGNLFLPQRKLRGYFVTIGNSPCGDPSYSQHDTYNVHVPKKSKKKINLLSQSSDIDKCLVLSCNLQ